MTSSRITTDMQCASHQSIPNGKGYLTGHCDCLQTASAAQTYSTYCRHGLQVERKPPRRGDRIHGERGHPMKTAAVLIIAGIWLAPPALADPTTTAPTPTPTPPILSTGGAVTGTNQGSSCSGRSGQLQAPATRTNPLWWVNQLDYPPNPPITVPGFGGVGCSR